MAMIKSDCNISNLTDSGFVFQIGKLTPILITTLSVALVTGVITVVRIVSPMSQWQCLTLASAVAAMEGSLTTSWLNRSRQQFNRLSYRVAEFVVIGVLIRIATWSLTNTSLNIETFERYLASPFSFLDGTFILYMTIAFISWQRSISFTNLFNKLVLNDAEIFYYNTPPNRRSQLGFDSFKPRDRFALLKRFLHEWLVGGFFLAFLAMATTFDLTYLANNLSGPSSLRTIGRIGLRPGLLLAMLVYFGVGFWLTSLARMLVMRARWLMAGVQVDSAMVSRWRRQSLTIIILVFLLASFLPIGSTLAISTIIEAVLGYLSIIAGAILALVALLISAITSFLFKGTQSSDSSPEVLDFDLPDVPQTELDLVVNPLVLGGVFWGIVIALTIASLIFYFRSRKIRIVNPNLRGQWRRIIAWLRQLWDKVDGTLNSISLLSIRRRKVKEQDQNSASPWRFIRISRLSPREQIRYFYLSVVRRAEKKGVDRDKSETPIEYSNDLKSGWPEVGEELEELTKAFLEARYSRRTLWKDEVQPVKNIWRRVRSIIRKKRPN